MLQAGAPSLLLTAHAAAEGNAWHAECTNPHHWGVQDQTVNMQVGTCLRRKAAVTAP